MKEEENEKSETFPKKLTDKELLNAINILLEIKELEIPICLSCNKMAKDMLSKSEERDIENETVELVKELIEFLDKIKADEKYKVMSIIDSFSFLILSLHACVINTTKEYREFVEKIRAMAFSRITQDYYTDEDFDDPSVR